MNPVTIATYDKENITCSSTRSRKDSDFLSVECFMAQRPMVSNDSISESFPKQRVRTPRILSCSHNQLSELQENNQNVTVRNAEKPNIERNIEDLSLTAQIKEALRLTHSN